MENLYFPLFLVVAAIVVVLVFKRAGSSDRSRRPRVAKTPAGRIANADLLRRDMDRLGRPSLHRSNPANPKNVWQTRRERAAKDSFAEETARRGTHFAGYLGPESEARYGSQHRRQGEYELKDQDISRAEHLSIDEYLTKREREEAEQAEKAAGFSMTAMKYEPTGAASKDQKGRKKQGGFKP